MSAKRYTEEFKIEAVKQVTERGHPSAACARCSTFIRAASTHGEPRRNPSAARKIGGFRVTSSSRGSRAARSTAIARSTRTCASSARPAVAIGSID